MPRTFGWAMRNCMTVSLRTSPRRRSLAGSRAEWSLGPWPKLHSALEPANDLLRGEVLSDTVIQFRIAHPNVRGIFQPEKALDLFIAKGWPQEGPLHAVTPVSPGDARLLL